MESIDFEVDWEDKLCFRIRDVRPLMLKLIWVVDGRIVKNGGCDFGIEWEFDLIKKLVLRSVNG